MRVLSRCANAQKNKRRMKNSSWISPDWNSNNSKGIKDCENQKWNDQNNVLKNDNVPIFRMGEFLVRIFNSNLNIVIVLKKQKLNKKKKQNVWTKFNGMAGASLLPVDYRHLFQLGISRPRDFRHFFFLLHKYFSFKQKMYSLLFCLALLFLVFDSGERRFAVRLTPLANVFPECL